MIKGELLVMLAIYMPNIGVMYCYVMLCYVMFWQALKLVSYLVYPSYAVTCTLGTDYFQVSIHAIN